MITAIFTWASDYCFKTVKKKIVNIFFKIFNCDPFLKIYVFRELGNLKGTKRRTNALLLMEVLSFDNTETVNL